MPKINLSLLKIIARKKPWRPSDATLKHSCECDSILLLAITFFDSLT